MKWVTLFFMLLLAAVLQAAVPPVPALGGAKLPFLLPVALYYTFAHEMGAMMVAIVTAAVAQDALGLIPMGYSLPLFFLVSMAFLSTRHSLQEDEFLTRMMIGGIAGFTVTLGLFLALVWTGAIHVGVGRGIAMALGTAVAASLTTPLVFGLAGWLDRVAGNVLPEQMIEAKGRHGLDGPVR